MVVPLHTQPAAEAVLEWYCDKGAEATLTKRTNKPPIWMTLFPAIADLQRRAQLWRVQAPLSSRRQQYLFAWLLRSNASALELIVAWLISITSTERINFVETLIISHRNATAFLLRRMEFWLSSIRLHLATHPLTPPDVLLRMLDYSDDGNDALTHRLACRHPNAPPDFFVYARRTLVKEKKYTHRDIIAMVPIGEPLPPEVLITPYGWTAFVEFVANLHGAFDIDAIYIQGQSPFWTERIRAVLQLSLITEPFARDLWNRSPLDLMHHLAHDGNRLVRWAAQTRLADPDFVFTWHEENR